MGRLSLFATLGALALLPLAGEALAAPSCDPARVMVLFDRSTSMIRGTIGGKTKWDIATSALRGVVSDYQSQAEFGLATFPQTDYDCKDGARLAVNPPALNAYTPISTALTAAYPSGAAWTPLGQSVREMSTLTSLSDASKRRYLIVVTDGAQDCPYGNYSVGFIDQRAEIWGTQLIVDQVDAVRAEGVKTFVIGFGAATSGTGGDDGVDAYTLNKMAVAGGTSIPGCNADGADPSRSDLCYYQANDAAELNAALEEIAIQVSVETCDGLDNNCNGQIDENLTQSCSTACGPGTQKCTNGTWGACSATQPQPEVCDGVDNNCNGQIDEGCACRNGDTRPCGHPAGNWPCKPGIQRCVDGQWSTVCEGEVGPQAEVCDGIDNNCDGQIDEGCECINGQTAPCGGPNVGQCKEGVKTCVNGHWGDCVGAVGPSKEICDGIDNNCDGHIDEPIKGTDDDVPRPVCNPVVNPSPPDAGVSPAVPSGDASGCACKVGGSTGGAPTGGVLLGLALLVGLVARRARR